MRPENAVPRPSQGYRPRWGIGENAWVALRMLIDYESERWVSPPSGRCVACSFISGAAHLRLRAHAQAGEGVVATGLSARVELNVLARAGSAFGAMGRAATSPALLRLGAEAAIEVPRAMAELQGSTFGDNCRRLGERAGNVTVPERTLEPNERLVARRIGAACRRVAVTLGGPNTCFPQAVAASRMLERRGIPTFALIGVKSGEQATMDAHAWIVAGRLIVTGAGPHRSHQPVLGFDRVASGARQ